MKDSDTVTVEIGDETKTAGISPGNTTVGCLRKRNELGVPPDTEAMLYRKSYMVPVEDSRILEGGEKIAFIVPVAATG